MKLHKSPETPAETWLRKYLFRVFGRFFFMYETETSPALAHKLVFSPAFVPCFLYLTTWRPPERHEEAGEGRGQEEGKKAVGTTRRLR